MTVLDQPETWPQGRMLLLGPDGSGKTHLATIWAAETGAMRIGASALRPDMVDLLASEDGAVVVEDAASRGLFPPGPNRRCFTCGTCARRGAAGCC